MSAVSSALKSLFKKANYEGIGSDQPNKEVKTEEKATTVAAVAFHGETTPLLSNANYNSYNTNG